MKTWSFARAASRVACLLCLAVLVSAAAAQDQDDDPALQRSELSRFFVDAMSFASDSSGVSRLDVYVEVPHHALQFIREGEIFHASYEASLTLYDSTGRLAAEQFWREEIDTKEFDATTSMRMAKLSQKSFLLAPGTYSVIAQVRDTETKKSTRVKRMAAVRRFDGAELSVSDPMLILRLSAEGDRKVIYPNIEGNVGELSDSFFVFFESYNRLGADSADVRMLVRNIRAEIVSADSSRLLVPLGRKACFAKVTSSRLIAGDYTIEIQVKLRGDARRDVPIARTAYGVRPFSVRWRGVPVSIVDLDLAMDQLQYLADGDKIDEMKKLSAEEKRKAFQEFWKRRDPTPNTERNELMEEYFARVAYANKSFGHYTDGWKTDRGMVYLIFGAPSNIERHPFDIDAKPYEIWTYYQIDREFLFVDATGFGDYRLQSPMWDVWRTRPR